MGMGIGMAIEGSKCSAEWILFGEFVGGEAAGVGCVDWMVGRVWVRGCVDGWMGWDFGGSF